MKYCTVDVRCMKYCTVDVRCMKYCTVDVRCMKYYSLLFSKCLSLLDSGDLCAAHHSLICDDCNVHN